MQHFPELGPNFKRCAALFEEASSLDSAFRLARHARAAYRLKAAALQFPPYSGNFPQTLDMMRSAAAAEATEVYLAEVRHLARRARQIRADLLSNALFAVADLEVYARALEHEAGVTHDHP